MFYCTKNEKNRENHEIQDDAVYISSLCIIDFRKIYTYWWYVKFKETNRRVKSKKERKVFSFNFLYFSLWFCYEHNVPLQHCHNIYLFSKLQHVYEASKALQKSYGWSNLACLGKSSTLFEKDTLRCLHHLALLHLHIRIPMGI